MGKTDAVLDMIGCRLATRPRPQLYVGPSKDFLTDQFEPRLMALLDEAKSLRFKVARGKRMKKTRKVVAGVPIRLAWAGSATQMSSDQAGDVHIDELDRMQDDIGGEGDVLVLARARSFTYKDRKIFVTSTPKEGNVLTYTDEVSGLEFWDIAEPKDVKSAIWKLWQSGTRHHWAWPCPHCGEYFIPRFRNLRWPSKATPHEAKESAYILCPRDDCGGVIEEEHKRRMNARGRYVAPGQQILPDGTVVGEPEKSLVLSFWVSGLASPFVTFGERAAAWLEAVRNGGPEAAKAVLNTAFGELYADSSTGEAPDWAMVKARGGTESEGYRRGEAEDIPESVLFPVITVDVQPSGLYWVIRNWGPRATSWLYDYGFLYGHTVEDDVWSALASMLETPVGNKPIRLGFIDSGFRPGKVIEFPENKVYEFCRRFPRLLRPTKGASHALRTPMVVSRIEVNQKGKASKFGLELIRLDTDHWKSWVHERIRWPGDQPGAWHLPYDVDDDYCQQIVSEARVQLPSGRVKWERISRANHFLDCEAMQAAAGYMLNVQRIDPAHVQQPEPRRAPDVPALIGADIVPAPAARPQQFLRRGGGYLSQGRGGFLSRR